MTQEEKLTALLAQIPSGDASAEAAAHAHWASLAKPLGSLGALETDLEQIASLTGSAKIPPFVKRLYVFCADNGVVAQGVTQTDSSVTAVVTKELALRRTAVCRMAERADCPMEVIDMGVLNFAGFDGVRDCRIRNGTDDFTKGPAMTREQAAAAILTGFRLAGEAKQDGVTLLAVGEMGIGNTSTSSAMASVFLGRSPVEMTGRGAGLSDEGLTRKVAAVEKGIAVNRPEAADPLGVLAAVGGLDIGGICGMILGGAYHRIPVLMDGLITNVAALLAGRLCPNARSAVLASHTSDEPAVAAVMGALDAHPLIDAGMRLGEGTGAMAAIPMLEMALAVYSEAYTFDEGGIEPYRPC